MAAGKLKEPKVITDFNQRIVCMLPADFCFNDERREKVWQRFDQKSDMLSMADLKKLFPDEETVQFPAEETGERFDHKKAEQSRHPGGSADRVRQPVPALNAGTLQPAAGGVHLVIRFRSNDRGHCLPVRADRLRRVCYCDALPAEVGVAPAASCSLAGFACSSTAWSCTVARSGSSWRSDRELCSSG